MELSAKERRSLADRVRALAPSVAAAVTEQFLQRHPDWVAKYGDRARVSCLEDAGYHLTFLSAALESGSPAAFADYARWTACVLESRGSPTTCLTENLAQLSEAVSSRLAADSREPVQEYIRAALNALTNGAADQRAAASNDPLSLTRSLYLQALLAGERKAALTIATEALKDGASALDLYVEVLQATLHEVGQLWETNRITVAHEHAATAITQFVMAHVYERLHRDAEVAPRGTLLITGLEGELHCVGALMVADVLEVRGWTVHFIGTNLPQQAILDSIVEHQPDCVGISATMLFNVPVVRRLIEGIREQGGKSKRIVLGGGAFRHAPHLWQELGADGHAVGLREVVGLFDQW